MCPYFLKDPYLPGMPTPTYCFVHHWTIFKPRHRQTDASWRSSLTYLRQNHTKKCVLESSLPYSYICNDCLSNSRFTFDRTKLEVTAIDGEECSPSHFNRSSSKPHFRPVKLFQLLFITSLFFMCRLLLAG